MSSKTLCAFVRFAAIATAVCGLALCCYVYPFRLSDLIGWNPGLGGGYIWLVYLWAASAPCFVILVYVWKVSNAIQRDEVFTQKTAKWIKTAATILLADVGFFAVGGFALLLAGLNRPGILFLSLLGCIFGISLALLAAVLARYISKAALLQEEADGTI
ncbi:MAG: DUF2975 domain-containing protein [Oscillospiraceae bacterium]|nr:DUF2975 domain-containing protein [Oscillospiraceae bacterium]